MPISTGINKRVSYKKEGTWGTLAGATGAQTLRRTTSTFNLEKESYQSEEIRTDYQIQDFRHGTRSVSGSLSGELSPGSYKDFQASAISGAWAAGAALTAQTLTIAVGAVVGGVQTYTIGTTPGNYLTAGFKIGDVIRVTVAANANNLNKNLLVIALTGTSATVVVLNGTSMTAETTAATSASISVTGKKVIAPISGHVDDSYTIEEFYADIAQAEVYVGNKVNTMSLALPATGLVTTEFGFMGKDYGTGYPAATAYFTSPTAQSSSGVLAAVNGFLLVNGTPVALLTNLNINVNRNMQAATVVGSNSAADIFEGRIVVDGDFSAYFQDGTLRDYFINENEVAIVAALTTGSAANADFMTVVLPRVKLSTNTRDDGETGITAQHSFQALLNSAGGTGIATEKTTIVFQDSLA